MNGPWQDDDPAGTIRLDESDIVEMESAADLFAPFPNELRQVASNIDTVRGTPSQLAQESPTREARMWDLSPRAAQHAGASAHHDDSPTNGRARTPYREVTAVRSNRDGERDREWIDMHAVVDDEGRLRLPEDVARALQSGAIVEVRLAAWAVKDS